MGFLGKIKSAVSKVTDHWWGKEEPTQPQSKREQKAEKKPRKPRRFTRKKKAPKPPAERTTAPKPTPAVAREMLMAKMQDMYWLQKKYDAAATSKRINRMTDAQVYRALDMSENDIETAVRARPADHPELAPPDDPNSNIYWYHGSEAMFT